MSEKIKAKCALCGAEKEIIAKPEPKNAKEKKEIAWRCACGAVMLRDGTAIYRKGLPLEAGSDDPPQKLPAKPAAPPEKKESGYSKALGMISVCAAIIGVMITFRKKKSPPAQPETKSPQAPGKPEVNYLGPVR